MNKIIRKLQIPGHETKMMIAPRKNAGFNTEMVPAGIQLSLDIELESNKQVSKK